jgi:hypothetical protein
MVRELGKLSPILPIRAEHSDGGIQKLYLPLGRFLRIFGRSSKVQPRVVLRVRPPHAAILVCVLQQQARTQADDS